MSIADRDSQYVKRWQACVSHAQNSLERHERRQLQQVKTFTVVKDEIMRLGNSSLPAAALEAFLSTRISLESVEKFSQYTITTLETKIDTSVIWSLLALLFKQLAGDPDGLTRVARMLKSIGQQTEDLHALCSNAPKEDWLKETALDIHIQLVFLFAEAVKVSCNLDSIDRAKDSSWAQLDSVYTSTVQCISDILARIERRIRWVSHDDEVQQLRMLLQLTPASFVNEARLPCRMLPPAKNAHFYDREDIIGRIDAHLCSNSQESKFKSFALHGLGGVGKSHVALKYAQSKLGEFSAIMWIHSETPAALEQSFTDMAIRLELPGAEPRRHIENKIQVLSWLQQTTAKWLLIFDNAEDSRLLLQYWPVTSHGCAIVTTRNHMMAFEPAETGIEVLPFNSEVGSRYLLHLLSKDIAIDVSASEARSARELSERLSGHALAISTMAGLIHGKSWTVEEFIERWERNPQRVEGNAALKTIWELSFESLNADCSNLLGVLAYVMPDSIPETLFESSEPSQIPKGFEFCLDSWDFSEILDSLMILALIKRDKTTKTLSIHRLVQSQFRLFLSGEQRQIAFSSAVKLLYECFPKMNKHGQLFDRLIICQKYSQHVSILVKHYKKDAGGTAQLKSTVDFCALLENFRRYLLESTSFEELADVLEVSRTAFESLRDADKNPHVLCRILESTGLMWAHRGYFVRSEPFVQEAHDKRLAMGTLDPSALAWSYTDIGNAIAAAGRYHEGLELHKKAWEAREMESSVDFPSFGITCQNLGRLYYFVESFPEAHHWCSKAVDFLTKSERWAMVAYTRFVLGNIYRAQHDYGKAQEQFSDAQNLWLYHGNLRTHHFRGACLYKLGCVALDRGNVDDAVKYLREALVISQLHQHVQGGEHARVLFKLSQALNSQTPPPNEAEVKLQEATSSLIARSKDAGLSTQEMKEMSFDRLVYILWR